MDKTKVEHHIKHLKDKHKQIQLDLTEATEQYDDILAIQIKKRKIEIER